MLTIEEFGKKIKEKYPQYANVNDRELGQKFLEKHPEYSDRVFDTDPNEQAKMSGDEPGGVSGAFKRGWQGLKEDLNKRTAKVGEAMGAQQSGASKALQVAGQGFGTIGDVIGAGISTAASALTPDEPEQAIKTKFTEGVKKIMETQTAKGTMEKYAKFKEENPELAGNIEAVGNIADAFLNAVGVGAAEKGVKQVGKAALKTGTKTTEEIAMAGEKVAGGAGKVIEKTIEGAKKVDTGGIAKTGASWATGLEKSTIDQITKFPERFTKEAMQGVDREAVFNKVKTAVDKRLEQLSETGKEYGSIRNSGEKVIFDTAKNDPIKNVLGRYGIDIADGKLVTTAESAPLGTGDIKAIQRFINQYMKTDDAGNIILSSNAFMNARKALSNMAKFAEDKTDMAGTIARELRKELDKAGKSTLTGLKDLDARFASEIKLLNKAKAAIYDKSGNIKSNAMTTIANLTGQGKEQILPIIEKIIPGISQDVDVLKAIQDIEKAKGIKVGTYMRGATGGFLASGGNPIATILSAVATSPQVAVPILRGISKINSSVKLNQADNAVDSGFQTSKNYVKNIRLPQKSESSKLKESIDRMKSKKRDESLSERMKKAAGIYDVKGTKTNPEYPSPVKISMEQLIPSEHDKFSDVKKMKGSSEIVKLYKEKIKNGEEISPALAIKHIEKNGEIWYEVSDGHHKIQAAKELGVMKFPVQIVRTIKEKSESSKLKESIDRMKSKKRDESVNLIKEENKPFSATVYRGYVAGIGDESIGGFYTTEKDRAEFYRLFKEKKTGKIGEVKQEKITLNKPLRVQEEHLDVFEEYQSKIPELKNVLKKIYGDESGTITDKEIVRGEKLLQQYARKKGYDGIVFGNGSIIIKSSRVSPITGKNRGTGKFKVVKVESDKPMIPRGEGDSGGTVPSNSLKVTQEKQSPKLSPFAQAVKQRKEREELISKNPKAKEFAKLWTGMDDRVAGIVGIDNGQKGNITYESIKKYITPETKKQLKNFTIDKPEKVYRVQRKGFDIQPLTAWTRNLDWAKQQAKKHKDFEILETTATPENVFADLDKILFSGIGELVLKKEGIKLNKKK